MKSKRNYYLTYTVLFLVMCGLVFGWYFFKGLTFVDRGDGWDQHLTALAYYGQYLRKILTVFLHEHRLIIPAWDFSLGEGSDILGVLHYYCIGDPLTVLSVFFPVRYTHYLYSFLGILRIYLAGIAFSALCFKTGIKNRLGVLCGALSYAFCGWALKNIVSDTYFLNPMIYFPLLILGVEKIIRKERPYLLILSVMVSALSNFYFFYMLAILTALYTCLRVFFLRQEMKKQRILLCFAGIAGASLLGVMLSGIILLPILNVFLNNSRISLSRPLYPLYPLEYYKLLPSYFFNIINTFSGHDIYGGFSVTVLLAIFSLFSHSKEKSFQKTLVLICLCFALFPVFGRFFNGMAITTNRWFWACSLLFCYVLASEWENLTALTFKTGKGIIIGIVCAVLICFLADRPGNIAWLSCLGLMIIILTLSMLMKAGQWKQRFLFAGTMLSVFLVSFWWNSPFNGARNTAATVAGITEIEDALTNNEAKAIRGAAQEDFVRYTGQSLKRNGALLNGVSSSQYYWSLTNPHVDAFRMDLNMREDIIHEYEGYDERSEIIALASDHYYVTSSQNNIPFGFSYLNSINPFEARTQKALSKAESRKGGALNEAEIAEIKASSDRYYHVYQNQYPLPLGYTYDRFITEETWESLSAIERQDAMMNAVYLSEKPQHITESESPEKMVSVPYTIENSNDSISFEEHKIIVTGGNQSIALKFSGSEKSETYFQITGLVFDQGALYDRSANDFKKYFLFDAENSAKFSLSSNGHSKYFMVRTFENQSTSGRKDFLVNLGYDEAPANGITITFHSPGVYFFDSINVFVKSMEQYDEKINSLKAEPLSEIEIGTNSIKGSISLKDPKVLCLAVPYSEGWKAGIDGEPAETFIANEQYIGIEIPSGGHQIRLDYETPLKKEGMILSILGCFIFWGVVFCNEKKRRNEVSENAEICGC